LLGFMVDEVTKVQTIDYSGVYPAVVEEVVNREDAAGLSLGALHTQRAFAHWTDQFQLGRRNWLHSQQQVRNCTMNLVR